MQPFKKMVTAIVFLLSLIVIGYQNFTPPQRLSLANEIVDVPRAVDSDKIKCEMKGKKTNLHCLSIGIQNDFHPKSGSEGDLKACAKSSAVDPERAANDKEEWFAKVYVSAADTLAKIKCEVSTDSENQGKVQISCPLKGLVVVERQRTLYFPEHDGRCVAVSRQTYDFLN